MQAAELNSLTKACVDAASDFNGNGQSDIAEYHGMLLANTKAWLEPFANFTYFVETHEGWFEPSAEPRAPGRYHIRERPRHSSESVGTQLPLFAGQRTSHAQDCTRRTDAWFSQEPTDAEPNTGMDFARFNANTMARFGHHSQFKCVELTSQLTAAERRSNPHHLDAYRELDKLRYKLHACTLEDAAFDCSDLGPEDWENGWVGWASVKYEHYADRQDYERGCVNECIDHPVFNTSQCQDIGLENYGCRDNIADYGAGSCGCKPSWKGDRCE